MKTMMRLVALALVVLASLTTLPSAAQTVTPLWPKNCAEFGRKLLDGSFPCHDRPSERESQ